MQPGPVTGGFDAGCRHHFLLLLPSDHLQEPEDIHLINVGFFPAAVFRIRDILRRRRILGSVNWLADPDPAISLVIFKKLIKMYGKFLKVFLLTVFLTLGTFSSL